jgi:hypothetical protein
MARRRASQGRVLSGRVDQGPELKRKAPVSVVSHPRSNRSGVVSGPVLAGHFFRLYGD